MPSVSFIMPVYNVENYVHTAIKSVLNQSYRNFELIIVNDGSTDNSLKVINETAKNDKRVKIINKTNAGVSAARNIGLLSATGEFVCFVDSDDELDDNLLTVSLKAISKHKELDILMYGMYTDKIGRNEKLMGRTEVKAKQKLYTFKNISEFSIDDHSLNLIGYVWNKLYKKSFLLNNQITFDESKSFLEDIDFNEKAYKYMTSLLVIDECLYYYKRRKRVSLINTFRMEDFEIQMQAISSRERIFKNWKLDPLIIQSTIAYLHVNAIKSSCGNLFVNKNALNFNSKCSIISEMLTSPMTHIRIDHYKASSIVGRVIKAVIKNKRTYTLAAISFIYSYRIKLLN